MQQLAYPYVPTDRQAKAHATHVDELLYRPTEERQVEAKVDLRVHRRFNSLS